MGLGKHTSGVRGAHRMLCWDAVRDAASEGGLCSISCPQGGVGLILGTSGFGGTHRQRWRAAGTHRSGRGLGTWAGHPEWRLQCLSKQSTYKDIPGVSSPVWTATRPPVSAWPLHFCACLSQGLWPGGGSPAGLQPSPPVSAQTLPGAPDTLAGLAEKRFLWFLASQTRP